METFTHFFNILLSLGLIIYSICIIGIFVSQKIQKIIQKQGLLAIVLISGVSMVASLIYSNGVGYVACDLCWYQRIFIYGTFFMALVAYCKKQPLFMLKPYITTFMTIGGIIALYHNIITYAQYNPLPCSATASCTMRYVYEFGFVTIPLMSLVTIVFILVITLKSKNNQ